MAGGYEFNTWNPQIHMEVLRGGFLGTELRKRTLSLIYTDRATKFDEVEWVLDNHDGFCTRAENLAVGLLFRIRLGYLGAQIPPQTFIINKIKGGPGVNSRNRMSVGSAASKITYTGRNRNAPGNIKGKGKIKKGKYAGPTSSVTQWDMFLGASSKSKGGTRIFHVRRTSDAIRQIAARNGFSGPYAIIEDTDDRVENVVIPGTKTDGEFVLEQARRFGRTFKIDHRGFHWHADQWGKSELAGPVEHLSYGARRGYTGITDIKIIGDIKLPLPLKVEASVRDHQVRLGQVASFDSLAAGLRGNTTGFYALGLPDPDSPGGKSILGAHDRLANLTRIEKFISPETVQVASTEATDRFIKRHLAALKLEVTCVGNPRLLAARTVYVGGCFTRLVDGLWWIEEAKHTFSGSTYTTKITVKKPPPKAKKAKITMGQILDELLIASGGKPVFTSQYYKNLD